MNTTPPTDKPSPYRHFSGMCWPVPGGYLHDAAYSLVHETIAMGEMKSRLLVAASVISAYEELIRLSARQRNAIIRELRKGPDPATISRATP